MSRSRSIRAVVATGALAAALTGPAAVAHASDSDIRAVVIHAGKTITNDESTLVQAEGKYLRTKDPAPVRTAIQHEIKDLKALRTKLGKQSSSTANGAKGKRLLVSGVSEIVTAYQRLDTVFANAGRDTAKARSESKKAIANVRKGQSEIAKGEKLLTPPATAS